MPPIVRAVAAIEATIVRIQQTGSCSRGSAALREIADAVRPGVVAIYGDAARTPLRRKDKAVVARCSAVRVLVDETEQIRAG